MMVPAVSGPASTYSVRPLRYRSLQTLLILSVFGSLLCSYWLLPSRLERVMAALERGDQPVLERELTRAAERPTDPGETRALADVALTLGEPEVAASILEQSLAQRPNSLTAMRRLIEIQRQRHRMRDVAALDERIYAQSGALEALREAADIYASQQRTSDRIDALRRLNAIGQTTAADIVELAHRLFDAGAAREASTLVMAWLDTSTKPLSVDIVALAAWLSAAAQDAQDVATRLGTLIGQAEETAPLYALIQTYAERGHPNLSLVAGLALGDTVQSKPEIALLLAELEAQQGQFASARQRLDALEKTGRLTPAGLPMLAELSLQMGDVARAATLMNGIVAEQMPGELLHRLVDTAFASGQMEALTRVAVGPIAVGTPGSAAVIALAHGDRAQAQALARRALEPTADLAELGPAFGSLVRTLGLERATVTRLLAAAKAGALGDQELSLLIDASTSLRAELPAVLQVLRTQRDRTPRSGVIWATAATRAGSVADVTAWLKERAGQMTTEVLLDLLLLGNERSSGELAHVAASALAGRADLPYGWTPAEIALAARATEPMTVARLRAGLALISAPQATLTVRSRIVADLVGAREFTRVAQSLPNSPESEAAVDWLVAAGSQVQAPETLQAELALLANVAPRRSLPLLAQVWTRDPRHLLPLYVAALSREHQADLAQSLLLPAIKGLPAKQQDAILYDTLAGLQPTDALPVLRTAARLGRDEWMSAYQDALSRAGLLDDLRTNLREQAATGQMSPTRRLAIASRLIELNDRIGAIGILEKLATGLRPSDPIVEQLVFLWGPRSSPDSIKWAHDQAVAAPLSDFPKWLEHLAYLGAPRLVVDLVKARPAILGANAQAVRTYGASLIAAGMQNKSDLAAAIAAHPAPDVADALAQLALDNGQAHPAWQAAREAISKAPNDAAGLLLAAQSSASVRRSSEAAALYTRLLALGPQEAAVMIDAGDAMLTAKQVEAGRRVLAAALLRLPAEPRTSAVARQRARALMLLKRRDEAVGLLTAWLARSPSDVGLRADLLQARLDEGENTR